MREETQVRFDAFQVDIGGECLWREDRAIKLPPKAFAMLRCLLDHAGQLVTKDALWREVWQGISVTDASLTMCLSEIRKALGDDAKTPRFIETVHRRGYRFIAPLTTTPPPVPSSKF